MPKSAEEIAKEAVRSGLEHLRLNAFGSWESDLIEGVAAAIREDRAEMEAERDDACENAREAHAIVSRVWKALGISKYADAHGKAIDEIVADLLKSHKAGLAERRGEELREDERLGKAMASAETAEAALTSERQRREEIENAARPFAFGDPILEQILFDGIPDDAPGTITATRGNFRKLRDCFRKYEPIPAGREGERGG